MHNMENTNKNWEDYLSKLQPNFLSPSEDNHNELLRSISLMFDSMPKQTSNDSVIGHLNDEHTYLKDFSNVPTEGVALEERLKVLGKVFS